MRWNRKGLHKRFKILPTTLYRTIPYLETKTTQWWPNWLLSLIPITKHPESHKKFGFRYTDLEDEELVTLIEMIIDSRDVNCQHKFYIGHTKQKIQITLKPNSEIKKQQPSKCPLHLRDKLEKLLGQLQDSGIIQEMGDYDELGSVFVNPIILLPKADYVKLVIDARYPNSITDLTNYSWPVEPVQMIMTRINGK